MWFLILERQKPYIDHAISGASTFTDISLTLKQHVHNLIDPTTANPPIAKVSILQGHNIIRGRCVSSPLTFNRKSFRHIRILFIIKYSTSIIYCDHGDIGTSSGNIATTTGNNTTTSGTIRGSTGSVDTLTIT